ncbi:ribosomal 60S subunit protein L38 [Saccharomycopsis crataegensis]|uniref:Ribosomal 60S subunit protein L38 n=1 Tax=Saccharomycopsis crataegensis TaxID=43959 RepID=A0AAV5QFP0_9ASCO|nr:ribosomal 60S subunit protein L38 [Saccharomycopsis crataegensis]
MAREIKDIKEFVELSRRKDVSKLTVKTAKKVNANGKKYTESKFKIRGTKNLYTIVLTDSDKASKLQQSLSPSLKVETIA